MTVKFSERKLVSSRHNFFYSKQLHNLCREIVPIADNDSIGLSFSILFQKFTTSI